MFTLPVALAGGSQLIGLVGRLICSCTCEEGDHLFKGGSHLIPLEGREDLTQLYTDVWQRDGWLSLASLVVLEFGRGGFHFIPLEGGSTSLVAFEGRSRLVGLGQSPSWSTDQLCGWGGPLNDGTIWMSTLCNDC